MSKISSSLLVYPSSASFTCVCAGGVWFHVCALSPYLLFHAFFLNIFLMGENAHVHVLYIVGMHTHFILRGGVTFYLF